MGPSTGCLERLAFALLCVCVGVVLLMTGFPKTGYIITGFGIASYLLHEVAVRRLRAQERASSEARVLTIDQKQSIEELDRRMGIEHESNCEAPQDIEP
jgi:hypothetical protein